MSLDQVDLDQLAALGFRPATIDIAANAIAILADGQPMSLRGCFYQMVSHGHLPSTDKEHYRALGRILTILREERVIPFRWIVDGVRSTMRPSSWSGLNDFADSVRNFYRRDFWASLPEYVHVIVEKDALAGVLVPVTRSYDVGLSIVRGYTSVSLAAEVADEWRRIEKPITCFYLGDYDPSGFDLERTIREKIARYSGRDFAWQRLGVTAEDFDTFDLRPLQPKAGDVRTKKFLADGYTVCAELDAIPADELRARLRSAIEGHIPVDQWAALQRVENLERDQWHRVLDQMRSAA